ncbi:hypothetical protein Q8A73_008662 [Channa argus]|nr:hypothetical protein Q8A73_008662 [Channa argus]
MRTFQSQSQPAQRGASSSLHSLSSSAMSPLSTASITFAALLILTIPVCKSSSAEFQQATTDQRQLLSQIDAVCSSYLSADMMFWASDVLGELCVLMLVQKSKELNVQENSKRTTKFYLVTGDDPCVAPSPTPSFSAPYQKRERKFSTRTIMYVTMLKPPPLNRSVQRRHRPQDLSCCT